MRKPSENSKKLKQTLRAVEKSLEGQPKNSDLIFQKGYLLFLMTKLETALATFSQALEIKPDFAQAYNARSIDHELHRYIDAISDCKHALNINQATKRRSTISRARNKN